MNKTENNPAAPGLVGCLADSQADTQPAKRKNLARKLANTFDIESFAII